LNLELDNHQLFRGMDRSPLQRQW